MFLQKLFLATLFVASSVPAGCFSEPAVSTDLARREVASSPAAGAAQNTDRSRQYKKHLATQRALGELSLVGYHNPELGVSLLYPRSYSLEEGNILEHSYFLRRPEELDLEKPGATLLATVLIPEDAYPNTTFEHGSLQFITEEAWTRLACRQAQAVGEGQSRRLKSLKIQEISFEGQENQSITGGTMVLERDYTGFAEGTCYEFLLVVASRDTAEESAKAADTVGIMKQLEKIAASLKVVPKTKAPTIAASTETSGRL